MILRGKGTSRDLACYCEQFWTPPFLPEPHPRPPNPAPSDTAPDNKAPPYRHVTSPALFGPRPPASPRLPWSRSPHRAELSPEGPRHTRSPPTPIRPPRPRLRAHGRAGTPRLTGCAVWQLLLPPPVCPACCGW